MATPLNELSKYRSYSYYHVLVVCDRTATANALASINEIEAWQHPTDEQDSPVKTIPMNNMSDAREGQYVVLINGSTDANYSIVGARWYGATAAEATAQDEGTSCAMEGSLDIEEPRGILFCDHVVLSCLAMGVDSANAVWVLKTFFVGYTDENGQDGMDYISDILPVQFIVYDLTANFTERGGEYSLTFVAITNGAARLPQYAKAVDGLTFHPKPNAQVVTLSDSCITLQDKINERYFKHHQCVIDSITRSAPPNIDIVEELDRYCYVEYAIELDEHYQDPKFIVVNDVQQYKDNATCNSPPIFKSASSIETTIRMLLEACPEIERERVEGIQNTTMNGVRYSTKYDYKIKSTVQSRYADDELRFYVTYRVDRFPIPQDSLLELMAPDQAGIISQENQNKLKQNTIEYDYIYSGKNIDILNFDLKLNLGLAYLQTATISNTFKQQVDVLPQRSTHINKFINQAARFSDGVTERKAKIPVFFGAQIRSPRLNNTVNQSMRVQSAYSISKHAALEVSDVTMKILGNPRLLSSLNRTSQESGMRALNNNEIGEAETTAFPHWTNIPAFCKVNVFMPSANDDLTIMMSKTGDYSKRFWFDGYYYVVAIEHEFEGGEFTQTLHMIGLPQPATFEELQNTRNQTEDFEKNVRTCFEGGTNTSFGCDSNPTTATNSPALPYTPTFTPPTPITSGERLLGTKFGTDCPGPDSIIDWTTKVPQNIKDAIWAAAQWLPIIGGSVECTAQYLGIIAYKESTWNPNAVAPGGTATGLFQFLKSTWEQNYSLFAKTITPATGIESGARGSQQFLDLRKNPLYSAYAACLFTKQNIQAVGSQYIDTATYGGGDLYMAHVLGSGGARILIEAINSGNGSMTFAQACAAKNPKGVPYWPYSATAQITPSDIIRRNPVGGATPQDSCETLRIKFANSLYARTTNNVTAVQQPELLQRRLDAIVDETVALVVPPKNYNGRRDLTPTACSKAAAVTDPTKQEEKPEIQNCVTDSNTTENPKEPQDNTLRDREIMRRIQEERR